MPIDEPVLLSLTQRIALGGTLSSYTWICMIINFLQTRNPPVLPTLQRRPHQCTVGANGKQSAFADNIGSLRGFGKNNRESIGELLFHFFRRYGHEIDYDHNVISIREGSLISKQAKKWHLMQNNRLCVEEPFNTDRNLGNTADDISFRGVHLELRRACDLIAEGKLDEALELYDFPPTAQTTWARPPPQPRPVLSRSASQSSRAGKSGSNNNRGSRQGQGQSRSGPSNRRASSAAAMNKLTNVQDSGQTISRNGMPTPPIIPNPNLQIQDQLYTQFQYLQQQEHALRMHLQQRVQAQQLQNPTAGQTMPASAAGSPYSPVQVVNTRRQTSHDAAPLSAPLRHGNSFYHPTPINHNRASNIITTPSQQSVHTNPSSPSMSPAQPDFTTNPELRRGVHRSSAAEASLAAIRSQSQPPSIRANPRSIPDPKLSAWMQTTTRDMRSHAVPSRPHPASKPNPAFQGACLGMSTLDQLPEFLARAEAEEAAKKARDPNYVTPQPPEGFWAQQEIYRSYIMAGMIPPVNVMAVRHLPVEETLLQEHTAPKEYVGYYVHDSPPTRPYSRLTPLANIPSYNDLVHRARGMSPDVARVKHSSRSPSPSSSSSRRERSVSFYSATSHVSSSHLATAPPGPISTTRRSGPIIANGSEASMSEYSTPPETLNPYFPAEISEAASLSDEPMDTPVTDSVTPSQELQDSFTLDSAVDSDRTNSIPTMLQFGEFPAKSTYRASIGSRSEDSTSTYTDVPTPRVPPAHRVGAEENVQGLGININATTSTSTSPNGEQMSSSSGITQPNTIQKVETGTSVLKLNMEKPLKPLPLLSPVREVRTPSPTTLRREEIKTDNANKAAHGRSISVATASLLSHTNDGNLQQRAENLALGSNSSPKTTQMQNSGWQQQTNKKKKNKNKKTNGSSGVVAQSTSGGGSERKGG